MSYGGICPATPSRSLLICRVRSMCIAACVDVGRSVSRAQPSVLLTQCRSLSGPDSVSLTWRRSKAVVRGGPKQGPTALPTGQRHLRDGSHLSAGVAFRLGRRCGQLHHLRSGFPLVARAAGRALILLGLWVVFWATAPESWDTGLVVDLNTCTSSAARRRHHRPGATATEQAQCASRVHSVWRQTGPSLIGYGDLQQAISGSATYPIPSRRAVDRPQEREVPSTQREFRRDRKRVIAAK